jgi:RNA polymerase sigma-70 factor (family 1)
MLVEHTDNPDEDYLEDSKDSSPQNGKVRNIKYAVIGKIYFGSIEADEKILRAFNSGDRFAFTAIYNKLYPSIFYFTKRYVFAEEAEDITADAFHKLWEMNKNFPRIIAIKTFLQVSTRNASFNYLEHKGVVRKVGNELLHLNEEKMEESQVREEIRAEFLKRIYYEMEKLPKQCKLICKLAYIDGLRNKEIAGKLNISENLVSHQKKRGIKLLRGILNVSDFLLLLLIISGDNLN